MRLNKMIMRTKRTILTVVMLEKIIFLMLFIAYCTVVTISIKNIAGIFLIMLKIVVMMAVKKRVIKIEVKVAIKEVMFTKLMVKMFVEIKTTTNLFSMRNY